MKSKGLYLALFVVGTIVPNVPFVSFLLEHGLDLPRIFRELFANRISMAFALDVLISSVVLWTLVAIEGRRLGMRRLWLPIAANVIAGMSSGLPLFLYLRERSRARSN